MLNIEIDKRTTGINFDSNNNAVISIYAPLKKSVSVKLMDTGTLVELHKDMYGYWSTTTTLIKPGDFYKIEADGVAFPDPSSLLQPQGVHGPSVAIDLQALVYKQPESQWKNIPLKDYIFYELHTGTFTSQGNFAGIEEKLDYLKDLGITAIEIMPVAQFPGSRNWGYDGVYPFAVEYEYGGYEGLSHLIESSHQKGLAVVMDVVYNHLGPEGNYLGAFAPYFTDKYHTPWGEAINFDDSYCDGVRKYFIENVLMWFRDFHIDALRLDAVHALRDSSATHILKEIKHHVNRLMAATGRTHYLIAELDLNDNRYINTAEKEGYGMDAQWIDEFHHALRVTAGGERTGYYEDFKGIQHLAKAYNDAYVYDGLYSPHRKKTFGIKAENNPGHQFIVFSQNHDQVGNRMLGERSSKLVSVEMQKLMAAAVFVSPYLPMLFMGEEYSEMNPFLYFISHTDETLCLAVTKGRKEEFAALHTAGEVPEPGSEDTFAESKLQWHLLLQKPHQVMLQYYKTLIALRKKETALSTGSRNHLHVTTDEDKQTLLLHRWHNGEHIFCCMNFSKQNQWVVIPEIQSTITKIFDSSNGSWQSIYEPLLLTGNQAILCPESIIIYKTVYE